MRISYSRFSEFKVFPHCITVKDFSGLLEVAQYNHTVGEFTGGVRTLETFLGCDALVMDVDNDSEVVYTPEDVFALIPAKCYVVYSRHHMLQKGKHPPKPRYHIYYPLGRVIRDFAEVSRIKQNLCARCPAFDPAATDATRLIFGVSQPSGLDMSCDSKQTVVELLSSAFRKIPPRDEQKTADVIPEGQRNDKLFRSALRIRSKYPEKVGFEIFIRESAKCVPPLSTPELRTIWKNAAKYVKLSENPTAQSTKTAEKSEKRKKTRLTLRLLEHELAERGVKVQYDIVTKNLIVSDFDPADTALPAHYADLSPEERALHRTALLIDYLDGALSDEYAFTRDSLSSYIANIARLNGVCAPLRLIDSGTWDGIDRFTQLCDLITPDLTVNVPWRMYIKKWMTQACALLENSVGHIGADICLVLQGAQGIRKTSFFRRLALRPEWFREGHILDMRIKDSIIGAVSAWITELGELDSTLVKEQSSLKAFLTANSDSYRVPYARVETKSPRVTSFCATVNPREFLRDMTGSRRFLVIPVLDIDRKIFDLEDEFFVKVWRQAMSWYRAGDSWRLTDEEQRLSESANSAYRTTLPYEDDIACLYAFDAPLDKWSEVNAGSVALALGLVGETRRIGRALAALARKDSRIKTRVGHGRMTWYTLPPLIRG